MPTIIDSLLITLGLDVKEYKQGQKQAEESLKKFGKEADQQSKTVRDQAKKQAEAYKQVKDSLVSLVAVAVGSQGIKSIIDNNVKMGASLGRLAKDFNMSGRELDAWGATAQSVGGSAQGVQSAFQSILGGFQAFKTGDVSSPIAQAFRALNVGLVDSKGNMRDVKDIMGDLSEAMKGKTRQEQIQLGGMLGIDDGTLNVLRMGRTEMMRTYDTMYKASGVTDKNIEQATKLQAQWALFKQELSGVSGVIFTQLAPALEKMLNLGIQLAEEFKKVDKATDGWASKLVVLAAGIMTVASALKTLNAIKTLAGGGAAAGGAAKAGGGIFTGFLSKVLGGIGLMAYSSDLNTGEDARMAEIRKGKPSNPTPAASGFSALESKYGLPQGTLAKIRKIESGGNNNAVSKTGATGPFQLMPKTAADLGLSRVDTFDLDKSSNAAAKYLSQLLKHYKGDMTKSVAAYNWGMGNLDKKGMGNMPDETTNYLNKFFGAGAGMSAKSGSQVETNIGQINIQTQATDAAGISRDIGKSLRSNALMTTNAMGMT